MGIGEMVEIDTTHAVLQGCARSVPESNDFASTCHTISSANPQAGVGVTTVHVFGSRALGPPYPSLGDIGRKLGMCFQARACPTCCYGLQHCVTVEIAGKNPKIKLPLVSLKCAAANFQSDQNIQTMLPYLDDYGNQFKPLSKPETNNPSPQRHASADYCLTPKRINIKP